MVLQRVRKHARLLLFFPLVRNQRGHGLHQIVLKNPLRTSCTSPSAIYPFPWRTRVHGLHLLHHFRSTLAQLRSGIFPTSRPFLQIFARWTLPLTCMCTPLCILARPAPLRSVRRPSSSRTLRSPGLWHTVRRPCLSGVLLRTGSRRTWSIRPGPTRHHRHPITVTLSPGRV